MVFVYHLLLPRTHSKETFVFGSLFDFDLNHFDFEHRTSGRPTTIFFLLLSYIDNTPDSWDQDFRFEYRVFFEINIIVGIMRNGIFFDHTRRNQSIVRYS